MAARRGSQRALPLLLVLGEPRRAAACALGRRAPPRCARAWCAASAARRAHAPCAASVPARTDRARPVGARPRPCANWWRACLAGMWSRAAAFSLTAARVPLLRSGAAAAGVGGRALEVRHAAAGIAAACSAGDCCAPWDAAPCAPRGVRPCPDCPPRMSRRAARRWRRGRTSRAICASWQRGA